MDRDHLDHDIDPELTRFFVAANFRFMTRAEGRPPSLYFTDGDGNMGRLRQGHEDGPELDFVSAGHHLRRVFLTADEMTEMQDHPENTPDIVAGASTVPAAGTFVFEFAGDWDPATDRYEIYDHLSGGTVVLGQQMPQFDLGDFADVINRV